MIMMMGVSNQQTNQQAVASRHGLADVAELPLLLFVHLVLLLCISPELVAVVLLLSPPIKKRNHHWGKELQARF
jgi:hypothetical protein